MTFRLFTLDDIDPNWQSRWRLGAALGTPGGMVLPVEKIFVHHTVSADTGDVVKDITGPCITDQGSFGKLSYSWNIHPSTRTVVEIEGTHRGAHTIDGHSASLNGISFGFGVIGNYHPSQPTPPPSPVGVPLVALIAEAIVRLAIRPGYAAPDVPILGHRDSGYATACCGDSLYARLPDIRAAVAQILNGPSQGELDMTPGQCRDTQGRKWHFYVDDDGKCSSMIDGKPNGRLLEQDPGWTSGFDAECDPDGTIAVCGRNAKGELAQIVFVPGGPSKPLYNVLGGHIYPAA